MTNAVLLSGDPITSARQPHSGLFELEQAKTLVTAGLSVGLISVSPIPRRLALGPYPYVSRETVDDVRVVRQYRRKLRPYRGALFNSVARTLVRRQLALLEDYGREHGIPDLIHAHNALHAGLVAVEAKRRHGIPYVLTEHRSGWLSDELPTVVRTAALPAFRGASRVWAVSARLAEAIVDRLEEIGEEDLPSIHVLPNILGSSFRRTICAAPPSEPIFLAVGNLVEVKRHGALLDAFAEGFAGTKARLRLIGDGPLRDDLARRVSRLRIGAQVSLLGALTPDQVASQMCAASAVVVSSRFETFGVVLIEALACGIPVVAPLGSGPDEIVGSSDGVMYEPQDPQALVEAMRSVLGMRSPQLDLQRQFRSRERFGPEAFLSRILPIYDEIVGSSSSR